MDDHTDWCFRNPHDRLMKLFAALARQVVKNLTGLAPRIDSNQEFATGICYVDVKRSCDFAFEEHRVSLPAIINLERKKMKLSPLGLQRTEAHACDFHLFGKSVCGDLKRA